MITNEEITKQLQAVKEKYKTASGAYFHYRGDDIGAQDELSSIIEKHGFPCEVANAGSFDSTGYDMNSFVVAWFNPDTNSIGTFTFISEMY